MHYALVARTKPGKDFSLEAVNPLFACAYGKAVDRQEISGDDARPIQAKAILERIDKAYGARE